MKAPQVLPKLYGMKLLADESILHAEKGEKEWEMIDMIVAKSSKSINGSWNGAALQLFSHPLQLPITRVLVQ